MPANTAVMTREGFKRVGVGGRPKRLIINVTAREKRGKTNFLLTAPGPIALFNFDNGIEGVVHKFSHKEIFVADFMDCNPLKPPNQAEAKTKIASFEKKYAAMLKEPSVRTLGIDTETELWEVGRLAEFGKTSQVIARHYEQINKQFDHYVQLVYGSDKNLIFLSKMREEYVADKTKEKELKTGNWIFAGYKNIPYLVQVDLLLDRDEDGQFTCTVRECRPAPELTGFVLYGEDINFPNLATMIFPDTDVEDWK